MQTKTNIKNFCKKVKGFTVLDNELLQKNLISYEALGLYCYMASLPEDWEFSVERLSRGSKAGVTKTTRIVNELLGLGLLTREFYNDEKGYRKSIYTLFDISNLNNPSKENPTLENPNKDNKGINKEINIQRNKFNKERILTNDNKERDNKEVIMQNENENQKENTLSWKEKAVNLFDEYKITNFSKDLWIKWIERKHEKHKETNLMSYDIDIQRLIRAKENANETLEINIAGGWKTIYTKTEQKQTSNNRYKGTCNDHEVRANWHKGDSDKTARDIMAIIERDLGKFDDSPSVENNSEELKNDKIYNNDNDLPF